MALIHCPECGREISDKATQCIHCGYPLPAVQEDCAYGRKNPSDRFDELRTQLLDEYGSPSTDFSGVTAWESGDYMLRLSYLDNTGGGLWLSYSYTPD